MFRLLSEKRVFFAIIPKNLPSGKRESLVFGSIFPTRAYYDNKPSAREAAFHGENVTIPSNLTEKFFTKTH